MHDDVIFTAQGRVNKNNIIMLKIVQFLSIRSSSSFSGSITSDLLLVTHEIHPALHTLSSVHYTLKSGSSCTLAQVI